ncbi:MAG: Nif3-like dinuclear metal center hexameric protein [Phascolarctobacterium sp.]|nr:Nif3-like dinuclear metal center hexameric protein [Phascolarctobacterium sp.]
MSVTVNDIIKLLKEMVPKELAEKWDNVGLMLGRREKPIKSIMLALDITPEVVEQALACKADLIITHHPAIFKKLGSITDDNWQQGLLLKLAESGIAVYSAHTNMDCAASGVNDVLAAMLKLNDVKPLDEESGLGRLGTTDISDAEEFAAFAKKALKAEYVVLGNAGKKVCKVLVCGGAGSELIETAKEKGADTMVTGDVRYHDAQNAVFSGINIIDAGHQATELPILEKLADRLSARLADRNAHIVITIAAETLLLRHI